jgi:hypothetical protein
MKLTSSSGWFLAGCLLLALLLTGCGPRRVTVSGKLTVAGEPLKGTPNEPTSMRFVPVLEGNASHPGYEANVTQETGEYKVVVPVGKYRIAVRHFLPGFKEQFGNKFTESSSTIVREVSDNQQINLDLSKPTGE